MENNGSVVLGWAVIILAASFIIYLLSIPVKMARKRGRSGFFWFFMGVLFTPFFPMVLLYFLGETDAKREERIIEEEQIRMRYRNL